jgi:hypothetical protein
MLVSGCLEGRAAKMPAKRESRYRRAIARLQRSMRQARWLRNAAAAMAVHREAENPACTPPMSRGLEPDADGTAGLGN